MNVDLGIWGKLTRVVIFLLLLAGVVVVGESYLPLIRQNERMRKDNLRLEMEVQKLEAANRQFMAEIDALRYDTNAVERLAREKLRYAKPDETVIVFQSSETNQSTR